LHFSKKSALATRDYSPPPIGYPWLAAGKLLNLIRLFLQQQVMDGLERWIPSSSTPQGAVLSPVLANIYLHPLDKFITEQGLKMVRYAFQVQVFLVKKT
jgi:retron-type reverse transcriptase